MKNQVLIPALLTSLLGVGGIALAAESHDHGAATATANITATGTVKSVDATKGKLVIDHDPIPARPWWKKSRSGEVPGRSRYVGD